MSSVDCPSVLPIPDSKKERCEKLKAAFITKYGHPPTFIARASGRVNLIGEHIDYHGYSVLPMAIEQDILAAVSTNDEGKLKLANTNPGYKDFESSSKESPIDKNNPSWEKYFLCGMRGVVEHLGLEEVKGMSCVLDGLIPSCAGLSSSSALVCCAALCTMHANAQRLSKTELSDLCASCERYIGTEGGGMDQAICFLAKPGIAKLIDFKPLKTTDIKLPEGAVFVISNSCVQMNKAATTHFNARVVEGRLACQLIAKGNGLAWRDMKRLKDLQVTLGVKLSDMPEVVKAAIHPEPYTKDELCGILGVSAEELAQTSLSANTSEMQNFNLYDRAMHVYQEAERVYQFKETCENSPSNVMEGLGQLMSDSHRSCRDLYQCSCPELDDLVETCLKAGAYGSRLTGAGWGGCAVSLVPTNQVQAFLSQVTAEFYNKDERRASQIKESLFATAPGGGAALYCL
ncbi:N-acetylgalactosamine kinase-like [Liolophura sinensis]|uniref:N-acetylgalactosamine kinase-like n=1 Tax=Liolophura sinensis TaxID=3198878 RepID=UPI003159065E